MSHFFASGGQSIGISVSGLTHTNGPDLYTLQTFQVLCKQDKKNEFLSTALVGVATPGIHWIALIFSFKVQIFFFD